VIADFSLTFASEYLKTISLKDHNRGILIIRAAVGGTGFLDHRWGLEDELYINMLEMIRTALSLNQKNKLVAFLWHQGETDAFLKAGYNTHYNHLFQLVQSVRQLFRESELPFMAGDFVHNWKNQNQAICDPVINAIRDVCHDLHRAGFVETNHLLSNDQSVHNTDIIHFCRDALYELGSRYYRSFLAIAGDLG
jgi:hypothetical protein